MPPAGRIPGVIVLALGVGALGFPDAMRLVAGRPRNPLLDIAACAVAMVVATAYALGTMLLARFVRSGGGDAPPADAFARLTFVVSLAAALLVSACLLFLPAPAPGAGGLPCHTVDAIAGESDVVVSALVAVGAVAAVVPFARRMLRLRTAPASTSSPTSSS
ncbi:uncharacterized protein LOC100275108 [Zea mays]|jgi:hypothetical protein|uniref:Uncharacterized protein n=1 Tax=Zea mays TaxID=4577 RepID=B6U869_MAIZE|nr:uncharacterized protein LOC100275108 [Zea mays]ACG45552.1 hypothetical protein [Zea mays]AQK70048.1 hypothetical protein ZEAMMB73_Zm00001d016085 [Zea mays]|eukprot:NP_001145169.1 uncharacterized protein LOC100275108 [Zea mays]